MRVCGLLNSLPSYRPGGLAVTQSEALTKRQSNDWGLPYLWAKGSSEDNPHGIFNESFVNHVKAARLLLNGQSEEAEAALAKVASNPRDHYELSILREQLGTEEMLKRIVQNGSALSEDPKVPGWTSELANMRVTRARARLDQLLAAREQQRAEAIRQAEAARRADAAMQAERERQRKAAQAAAIAQRAANQEAARRRQIDEEEKERQVEAAEQKALKDGTYRISARDLNAAYQTNEVAADEKFRGKTILVDGVVDEISKDFRDQIYLAIRTGVFLQSIHAEFDDQQKSEIIKLQPGQKVRVKGRVKGLLMRSVFLGNCRLVREK